MGRKKILFKEQILLITFITKTLMLSIDEQYSLNYISGCKQYDENLDYSSCFMCYFGYSLKKNSKLIKNVTTPFNSCIKCEKGCKKCSPKSPSECDECFTTFYLDIDRKKCEKCNFGCKICSKNNEKCVKCREPFYYDTKTMKCNGCMSDCQKCSEKNTCKVCFPGYPMSEDGTMCINLENNSREFTFVYISTAIFGLLVIMIAVCYLLCDCCTIQHDTDPLDFLRYSYLIPNDEVMGSVGERGSQVGVMRRLPESNNVRFFKHNNVDEE